MQPQPSFLPQQMADRRNACFHHQKEETRRCEPPSCHPNGLDQTLPHYPTDLPNDVGRTSPERVPSLWGCEILAKQKPNTEKEALNVAETRSFLPGSSLLRGLVSKETVVLRRLGVETTVWFINRVDN